MQEEELLPGCELSSLRHLDLTAAGIKDLGSVFAANGPFTALTGLTLDSNHLTNLAPLSGLTRLMSLHINSNKSLDGNTTSTPAGTASSTSTLCFEKPCGPDAPHSHGIRSLTEASSHPSMLRVLLPALQTLQLASCGLTSLAPLKLQCLPALRSLFVQGNELSKLDGLGGLVQLRELVADKNRIRWVLGWLDPVSSY
jgi:Leucine-rich repeat (LRR) protein